jgi:2-octaprenyl-6-methoxyphenol hydroxylase
MHARRYTGDRFALAGDAAHGMHPIAGQGVNLGFRDVGVLLELIERQHKLGLDIGGAALLAHYERWRAFDNVAMLAATDLINRLFSNDVIPLQAARRVGLWMVGQMPPVKRFFMRHAMGLVGDTPGSARIK